MTSTIDVLDCEGPCLVVNKPSGVLTQAPPGIDSMEARVRDYWQALGSPTGSPYVGVPHRLDRPVSGTLIFARHRRAAQRLSHQFAARQVDKYYLAIVSGVLKEPMGVWTDHLVKDPDRAFVRVTDAGNPRAMLASLSFQVVAVREDQTWVAVTLQTGRMHQIRVQFAERGHPVLGDVQYGSQHPFGGLIADPRQRPIALHARRIRFRHPTMPHFVTVTAPIPSNWSDLAPDCESWITDLEQ